MGEARHVSVASGVYGDAETKVKSIPAEVSGIDERGAGGIQLYHEGVNVKGGAAEEWLEGSVSNREVGGASIARHVRVAFGVHGYPPAGISRAAAAEVGGVSEYRIDN